MHDSGAQDEKRILIYTTYDNIHYISASTTRFTDSIFKMTPTHFTQLFTVRSLVLGYTMPPIYALTMKG